MSKKFKLTFDPNLMVRVYGPVFSADQGYDRPIYIFQGYAFKGMPADVTEEEIPSVE